MHVTKVQLENIKSHANAEFNFERGTIAITGENGAGKTTIIEAIAYALFDFLDYKPKDNFIRRGAKKGVVRVSFISDLDEREYVVYRDTGQGYYVFDPELNVRIAEKKEVSTFLHQHLGIEAGTDLEALFRSAIGVPQGTFTADFLRTAADRKKSFDKLLKVEEYKKSADELLKTVNLIKDKSNEVEKRIENAKGQLSRYNEIENEYKNITANLKELNETLAALQKEIKERSRVVNELDKAETKVNETSNRKERLSVASEEAARRLKEKKTERDKAKAAAEKLNVIETDYKNHLAALETLSQLETQRAARDKLKNEATKIESSIVASQNEIKRLENEIAKAIQAGVDAKELKPLIEKQESFEKKREELIAKRAQAQSARESFNKIETERNTLREQYKQIKKQIDEAAQHKDAEENAKGLQGERMEVETQLSVNEKAATSQGHLQSQRKDVSKEVERLKKEITAHEKEIAELEKFSSLASKVSELTAKENELTESLARLRASIERDEKFQSEVKNGLCPILSERCLNVEKKEGQTLEDYFKGQFENYKTQLATLEKEKKDVSVSVREAREAEKHLSKLERAKEQLAQERKLFAERQETLKRIDDELSSIPSDAKERAKELKSKLVLIDAELIKANEAAKLYAGLKPLQQRLDEVEKEGISKKTESDQIAKVANQFEKIEKEISATEKDLKKLNDPRLRETVLLNEAARETGLKAELESANKKSEEFQSHANALNEQLREFLQLDSLWNAAREQRDKTASNYREYLVAKSLADELPQRQNELDKAAEEHKRKESEAKDAAKEYNESLKLYDRERHAKERVALSSSREQSAKVSAQLESATQREASLKTELEVLAKVREEMREEFNQKEKLDELHDATEFIRDTLKKAGPIVTESYLYNINLESNQLFREISGDASRTLKWSRDYEIILEESGYERPFQNLSGGEQMAAALSVRLALLKQLSDIRIAFFDEPTTNMDLTRRERLAEQIGQITNFDQLFVISHDDAFTNSVDNTIHVAKEKDETSVQPSDDE
jgi:exonuclease SbcC